MYGNLTNNSASANLTLGDRLINNAYMAVCAERDWNFLLRTNTFVTVASQQAYDLPSDYGQLVSVNILVGGGSYQFVPTEVSSATEWDRINESTQFTSDYPVYFFVFNGQIKFWPTPSTAGETVTVTYRKKVVDLSVADYTTGSVSALTAAATAVTGSSTTWTAPMAGRYIQLTPSNTAGASGDNRWYLIDAVGSTTSITLATAYLGLTVSGSTSYTIGEMSALPEEYQHLPVYLACKVYFTTIEPELDRARVFDEEYNQIYGQFVEAYAMQTANVNIETERRPVINPNLLISI